MGLIILCLLVLAGLTAYLGVPPDAPHKAPVRATEWADTCRALALQAIRDEEMWCSADTDAAYACLLFSSLAFQRVQAREYFERESLRRDEDLSVIVKKVLQNPPVQHGCTDWPSENELRKWAESLGMEYKVGGSFFSREFILLNLIGNCRAHPDSADLRQRLQVAIGLTDILREARFWGEPTSSLTFAFLDEQFEAEMGPKPEKMLQEFTLLDIPQTESAPPELLAAEKAYLDRLYAWIEKNIMYFYGHEDGVICIDYEARRQGIPTDEFRKAHPWKPTDRPNQRTSRWVQK